MPFHRFEEIESRRLTAHLSSGRAPIIEGQQLYFCLNQKKAGTGSELHYHPNELLIFVLEGRVNAVIGKDHRIAETGTCMIIPPNVRHSMRATEDGPCAYLYIKDRTWTVVGVGADEPLPERPLTMDQSEEIHRQSGDRSAVEVKSSGASQAIVEGVPDCFFPLTDKLQGGYRYGKHVEWIEGERGAFGFFEVPAEFQTSGSGEHEQFYYLCDGELNARIGGEMRRMRPGDIAHIPPGTTYLLDTKDAGPARFVGVRATDYLADRLDRAA